MLALLFCAETVCVVVQDADLSKRFVVRTAPVGIPTSMRWQKRRSKSTRIIILCPTYLVCTETL